MRGSIVRRKAEELAKLIEETILDRKTRLDFHFSNLTNIPESLGNLSMLTRLEMTRHQFTRLPESIGNLTNLAHLYLCDNQLTSLPESIGDLSNLTYLNLQDNQLISLPDSIENLCNLTHLYLGNKFTSLPECLGNLASLTHLYLSDNQFTTLPECIGNLSRLEVLHLDNNQITNLPDFIGNLSNLVELELSNNKLTSLPASIGNASNLTYLNLNGNDINDLSVLRGLEKMCEENRYYDNVEILNIYLPSKYWTKFSDWRSDWLLTEYNSEIKRVLIQQIGYEKISQELDMRELDNYREYTLVTIDDARFYDDYSHEEVIEPMVLLKMTCPSTGHIHILRVPPEMTSAEAAITWVNHGIHPDEFTVQT